ncbi:MULTISPECIES: hypothetical protein [Pyrobaculum]|uniref:Uncharacterized protein n=2 Tax=Pyrobaculum arsenaticum TaxID=121277 RepID=A4WJU0_PYRAR|nr:hypothetical protein [Pyrobaculum arsenaticum]ABP50657.1 hypothetical protein Pars_1079 [Pyrobaculum arsenaticum DSM 13514]MCY0889586.1 hypothetical protein [Pyrobaculum arsenaticum]NYR14410.1 hypothetical protein [Pyrobaculum arsenaticum]
MSQRSELKSIKTYMLVALVFAILSLIVYIIIVALYLIVSIVAPPAAIIGVVFIALLVVDAVVLMRIYKMYTAAKNGDISTLKSLNSIGWAIVALLFSGLIPGIMMLLAHSPIERLQQE